MIGSLVGQTIGGCRINQHIGVGGMGSVFRATQSTTQRDVAVKLLRPELLDAELVRRFELEMETLAKLHHPNIARVYSGGAEPIHSVTIPYFVMEFVSHATPIHTYVHDASLSIEAKLRMFLQICAAIVHAHNRGVIHRDIKSDNILVDAQQADPQPKVIDFGIARRLGSSDSTAITVAGDILGSFESMSPEQAAGDATSVDVRTDVYALCAVLYQMLTGKPAISTDSLPASEAIQRILTEHPDPPSRHAPGIRSGLDAIVLKGLAKRSSGRYESVGALATDIQAFLEGRAVGAVNPGAVERLRRTASRYKKVLVPGLLILVLALAGTVVSARYAWIAGRDAEQMNRLAYRASLNAASSTLRGVEAPAARQLLAQSPEHLRGWEWRHLQSRSAAQHRSLGLLPRESDLLAMSPSGRHYAYVTWPDSTVHVCDAKTGSETSSTQYAGTATFLTFETDGRLLIHSERQRDALLTQIAVDGGILAAWPRELRSGHGARIARTRRGAYSPTQGGRLALPEEGSVTVYGVSERRTLWTRPLDDVKISGTAFRNDGKQLASAQRDQSGDFVVAIYDVSNAQEVQRLTGGNDDFYQLRFTPDDQYLFASGADGAAYVWKPSEASAPLAILRASGDPGQWITVSGDGRLVAMASFDGNIRYWDVETLELLGVINAGTPQRTGLRFRPGTLELYGADDNEPVKVWDLGSQDPTLLARHASYVYPVELSERHRVAITGGWDGYVGSSGSLVWTDLETGTTLAALGPPGTVVLDAKVSRNGNEVLATIYTLDVDDTIARVEPVRNAGSPANPRSDASLSAPPGTGLLARIDVATREVLQVYRYPQTIHFLDTSPSFDRAVLGDREGRVRVVDLDDGSVLWETEAGFGEARDRAPVAWSPDGRWLAVALSQERIQILDARTLEVLAEFGGHEDWIWSLSFDAAGTRLLSASNDQTVGVWSVPSGDRLATLDGHGSGVLCAKFHPSEERIVCGIRGGEVWFWQSEDYEPLVSLRLHDGYIFDLEWTADGSQLITGSGDGTVRRWVDS